MEVKNPYKGCMLVRNIKRAIYCVENHDKDMSEWFEMQNSITPEEFLDKWGKKLL